MSGGIDLLKLREEDVMKLLACQVHIGSQNVNFQMENYIWKRRSDGTFLIHLARTWEKVLLAARAIAAIENPADICVVSSRTYAQRAILKFAAHTGATPIFGRFTPGCLTNQAQEKKFKEPRLLVISDPQMDHQAVTEASYVNIPVISFANSESPLKHIDIAIPSNNKGTQAIGLMWWMLAREVLILKGKITRQSGFTLEDKEIMPDLYFYRDPEEAEKEEQVEGMTGEVKDEQRWGGGIAEAAPAALAPEVTPATVDSSRMFEQVTQIQDWARETEQWSGAATGGGAAQADDWGASRATANW